MMPDICYIDVETACALEMKKTGAPRYSRDASLICTVVGWAFDNEPAQAETVLTLGPRRLPPEVEKHIREGGMVSGWNSRGFESNIIRNYFGLPLPPEQVTDTMQAALHAGLPAALGDAGMALGLAIVKDATAHRLMLQCARPRAIRPDGSCRWWHEEDPEKLERLRLYCAQDVEAERAIAKAIPKLPEREVQVSLLDARANEKGVRVDVPVVRRMIAIADASTKKLNAECNRLTNGAVTSPGSQTARLLAWLGEHSPGDLTKDTVAKALARDDLPAHVRRVLEIRQLAAKSSIKKLQAVLSCIDDDDAIRGMLAYYGAARTGRWCLAEGSRIRVLTAEGVETEKPIEVVLLTDRVWDGAEWVEHEGVVFSGVKDVISHDGVVATKEHTVYLSESTKTTLGEAASLGLSLWRGNP